MKEIFEKSFWQLLIIYTLIIAIITAKVISKYALHFEILALAVAVLGCISLKIKEKTHKQIKYVVWLAIIFIILLRLIPYIHNDIPLGYDAGFYTAAVDQYAENNVGKWFQKWGPPGLFMLTTVFKKFGVDTSVILTAGVVLLEILLGIMIYLVASEFFNKTAAGVSILLYSVSLAQYVTFTHMYLKNILGMILLLAAVLFLKKGKYTPATLTGILLAGTHRPTFLLFGLIYLAHTATRIKDRKELAKLTGIGILILSAGLLFYIAEFRALIGYHVRTLFETAGGSFMTSEQYMLSTLSYLLFAFMGYLFALKNKKFNLLFFWFTANSAIVFLKLFFYNRFVIFLDIIFILYAGYAFSQLFTLKTKTTIAILIITLLSMMVSTGTRAFAEKPNISPTEYQFMQHIPDHTESNSTILSNMVDDAHWLEALSQRPVSAPGLFERGKWTLLQWKEYWHADNFTMVKELMDMHPRPLYIYLGESSPRGEIKKFETCTEKTKQQGKMELLRYTC